MKRKIWRSPLLLVLVQSVVLGAPPLLVVQAQPAIPTVWDIVAESFESGNLDAWGQVSADDLSQIPGSERYGSDDGADEYYPTPAESQARTRWEDHGQASDPHFWDYGVEDHDLHDGSWPDFHPTIASDKLMDQRTVTLPDSLATLLTAFEVEALHWGAAYDISRYEAGFSLLATLPSQGIELAGLAQYVLCLYPSDLPFDLALVAANRSPSLTLSLESAVTSVDAIAKLIITDFHSGSSLPSGVRYAVAITGTEEAVLYNRLLSGCRWAARGFTCPSSAETDRETPSKESAP
jgi:hypothetical protein